MAGPFVLKSTGLINISWISILYILVIFRTGEGQMADNEGTCDIVFLW